MTTYWRNAGLRLVLDIEIAKTHGSFSLYSYLQYSAICARLLRQALKPEYKAKALKQEESSLKVSKWKNGEPGKSGVHFFLKIPDPVYASMTVCVLVIHRTPCQSCIVPCVCSYAK